MYNTILVSFVWLSPLILQTTTPAQTISTDTTGDILKLALTLILALLSPFIVTRINQIRDAVNTSKVESQKNSKSVQVLETSQGDILGRVSRLESDLSKAIYERDRAQQLIITNAAAAEAAKQFSDVQIKLLTDQIRTKDNDLITERVINSELANNIREMREKIVKLEERCMLLENSGPIADAIAKQLLDMNSTT